MLPVTERVADPKFRALGTSRGQERRPGPVPFPRCFFQFSLLISSNLCSFKSLLSDRKAASPNYLAQQLVYSLNCDFQSTYIQRTLTTDKITANTRSLCSPWTLKKSFVELLLFRYPHTFLISANIIVKVSTPTFAKQFLMGVGLN